jgi:methionine synthase II (cobalamin-independent)
MTFATGIGSHPGSDQAAYDEALRQVLDVLGGDGDAGPGLPYVPEVPGRGAGAAMTGRALTLQTGLDVDLQPAGWRLTGTSGSPGLDQRRARSLLMQDLDALEERVQGYVGPFKVQVAGPWTLAATTERPRGDKVLADHGARRDLAQALAEGVTDHVAELRRRVPGCTRVVVQVDEPALVAVQQARVPTASGWGQHRSVDRPELAEVLGWVLAAAADADAEPWVHACAADVPWALLRGAGAQGLLVDADLLGAGDLDQLAEAYEAGVAVGLGVVATHPAPTAAPAEKRLAERASRWLDTLGLAPGDRLGLVPACGLAGVPAAVAPRVLQALHDAARRVDEG